MIINQCFDHYAIVFARRRSGNRRERAFSPQNITPRAFKDGKLLVLKAPEILKRARRYTFFLLRQQNQTLAGQMAPSGEGKSVPTHGHTPNARNMREIEKRSFVLHFLFGRCNERLRRINTLDTERHPWGEHARTHPKYSHVNEKGKLIQIKRGNAIKVYIWRVFCTLQVYPIWTCWQRDIARNVR